MQVLIISDYEKLSCMTSMEGGYANEYNIIEKAMSEEDIKLQYITPAITSKWDRGKITMETQVRIYILFNTGLRISEFCGLTLADIDFKKNRICVFQQLQRLEK